MTTGISDEARAAIASMAGEHRLVLTQLKGGRNNLVLRVDAGPNVYVAKVYFTHPGDTRDRMGTELGVLSFLWQHGLRSIPEPIASSASARVALYQFIDGERIDPESVGENEVRQLSDLLLDMWRLRTAPGAGQLPAASEASFSLGAYIEHVAERLRRVRAAFAFGAPSAEDRDPLAEPARALVEDEITCLLEPCVEHLKDRLSHSKRSKDVQPGSDGLSSVLAADERTLTPADHGFHNALRVRSGSLVFLDYEYAGWDDPAQMIANACLHPAVPIPKVLRDDFVRGLVRGMHGGQRVLQRLSAIYPLLALKWTLIMLNEFLPVSQERREFSGTEPRHRRLEQLAKASEHVAAVWTALENSTFSSLNSEFEGSEARDLA